MVIQLALLYALNNIYNDNFIRIKLLINNKTNIYQKHLRWITPLLLALDNKYNNNIIKLLINKKTDINYEKINSQESHLKILLRNYSKKSIFFILSFFYVNKKFVDGNKLIVDNSNCRFFLDI